jgi:exodeoxyribonuclease-5
MIAELPMLGSRSGMNASQVLTAGIADAGVLDEAGHVTAIVDWKATPSPTEALRQHHADQVAEYLRLIDCPHGLVIYMTTGEVVEVTPGR